MGDPKFLSKSKITKNDICNYMLSEIEDALNIARAGHSRDFSHELAADRSILN